MTSTAQRRRLSPLRRRVGVRRRALTVTVTKIGENQPRGRPRVKPAAAVNRRATPEPSLSARILPSLWVRIPWLVMKL